jgi:hypothetical protein
LYAPANAVNYLTISATDAVSKQPELKFCAVAVERVVRPAEAHDDASTPALTAGGSFSAGTL